MLVEIESLLDLICGFEPVRRGAEPVGSNSVPQFQP